MDKGRQDRVPLLVHPLCPRLLLHGRSGDLKVLYKTMIPLILPSPLSHPPSLLNLSLALPSQPLSHPPSLLNLSHPPFSISLSPSLLNLSLTLPPGFFLGRLCVLDQPHPPPRPHSDGDRTLLSSHLRGLLNSECMHILRPSLSHDIIPLPSRCMCWGPSFPCRSLSLASNLCSPVSTWR